MNFLLSTDSYIEAGEFSFIEDYANKGFKLSSSLIKLKKDRMEHFLEKVMLKYGDLKISTMEVGNYFKKVCVNDSFIIDVSYQKNTSVFEVRFFAKFYEVLDGLSNIVKDYEDYVTESEIMIDYFFMSSQGLKRTTTFKNLSDFETSSKEYYPYLDISEMYNQFLLSDNSILILCGEPGTGKSQLGNLFMKHMLTSEIFSEREGLDEPYSISCAYIKNEQILSDDSFWADLTTSNLDLVFLDDLDYSLLPRTREISSDLDVKKNKFISYFLSFTDGIFLENKRTKFIITTNKDVSEIDTAILRKGRTFDILNLRALFNDEAKNIWQLEDLPIEMFEDRFSTKEKVLACDLGSEITELKAAIKHNRERKPYTLEEGISIYSSSKIKNNKSLGFKSTKGK